MTTVLDILLLRRPKLDYVCPPICEVLFSATGTPIIVLDPILHPTGPTGLVRGGVGHNFLTWNNYPGEVCHSLYYATDPDPSSPYNLISECVPANSISVCSPGWFKLSVNTPDGESPLTSPYYSAGDGYLDIPLPQFPNTISYNLYKCPDPTPAGEFGTYSPYWVAFVGSGFEMCEPGCYRIGVITPDGPSDLSDPICIDDPPGDCDQCFDPDDTSDQPPCCQPGYIWDSGVCSCVLCEEQECPVNFIWDFELCECVENVGPIACINWDDIVWDIVHLDNGSGSASGSAVGGTIEFELAVPAWPLAPDNAVAEFTGHIEAVILDPCDAKIIVNCEVSYGIENLREITVASDLTGIIFQVAPIPQNVVGITEWPFTIPALPPGDIIRIFVQGVANGGFDFLPLASGSKYTITFTIP